MNPKNCIINTPRVRFGCVNCNAPCFLGGGGAHCLQHAASGVRLTLGFEPDYLLIQEVHLLLQLSFHLLHILEAIAQGLDFGFMLVADRK